MFLRNMTFPYFITPRTESSSADDIIGCWFLVDQIVPKPEFMVNKLKERKILYMGHSTLLWKLVWYWNKTQFIQENDKLNWLIKVGALI